MKVKVIKDFIDKNSNALCKEGSILDFSEERIKEINSTVYGVFLARADEEIIGVVEDKATSDDKPLTEMTVAELKELANALGVELDNKDRKDDIIAKISEFQQEDEQEEE